MKITLKIYLLSYIFFFCISTFQAQNRSDNFKQQAQLLMRGGRYGEAIDDLNKYISANPREPSGYHLRALCFEKRIDYQFAVLDLRRAIRLDPSNEKIKNDLDRVIAVWHKQLYTKIDGHKRDIAIDPNKAESYLEIGKSYRWLEEWKNAELWYDEYLKRDDNASPDEIIRYTEILAKTGSIVKGEKILKKFTDRYPTDWRLWSRYGYFTLWLGKNKIAENAFTTSLGFKPYFKEAQDGLDLAKNQGYLTQYPGRAYERVEYPIDKYYRILQSDPNNDDVRQELVGELINTNRFEEAFQQLQLLSVKHSEEEKFKSYSKIITAHRDSTLNNTVEHYTEILKNNPSDKDAVMKISEAYANLYYYDNAIEILSEYLNNIPQDSSLDARFMYAKYTAYNYEWDKSVTQLNKLLELDPDNLNYQLLRGQISAWTLNDIDEGEKYLLNVVQKRPNDISAILALSSLYLWKNDFEESKKYLEMAKELSPLNPDVEAVESNYALHLSAFEEQKVFKLRFEAGELAQAGNYEEALAKYEEFKSKRKSLSYEEMMEYASIISANKDYKKAIGIYDKMLNEKYDPKVALERAKDYYFDQDSTQAIEELEKLNKENPDDDNIRAVLADSYVMNNKPALAEIIYRDLEKKASDEKSKNDIMRRFIYLGEGFAKNKNYNKADSIYNEVLAKSNDNEIIHSVHQHQIWLGDALIQDNKLDDAEKLFDHVNESIKDSTERKDLDTRRLYLGDAYAQEEKYGDAKDIYNDLLSTAKDTSDIRIIKQRIDWLPPSGFSKGLYSIGSFLNYFLPTNMGLSPFTSYYRDNQDFQFWNYGLRYDAGFIGFLSLGVLWSRIFLYNSVDNREFTEFKGLASIYFSKYVSLSGSYGVLNYTYEPNRKIGDITLRYQKPEEALVSFTYENNDARVVLFSPNIFYKRFNIDIYRANLAYMYKNDFKLLLNYNYYNIGDGNEGNDIQIRFGKKFLVNGMFGYEYYFSDYKFISPYYYSPQYFDSHSLWTEWNFHFKNYLKLTVGGKIGYVPKLDFIIGDVFAEAKYNPFSNLIISGRITYSNSYRYDYSYKSFSALLTVFWGIY